MKKKKYQKEELHQMILKGQNDKSYKIALNYIYEQNQDIIGRLANTFDIDETTVRSAYHKAILKTITLIIQEKTTINNFNAFLYRVTRWEVKDAKRKIRLTQEREGGLLENTNPKTTNKGSMNEGQDFFNKYLLSAIGKVCNEILLKNALGFSHEEISKQLDFELVQCRVRLYRCKKQLQKMLSSNSGLQSELKTLLS